MAVNPFVMQDYLGTARSRVTEQFKDKPVFDKFLRLLTLGVEKAQDTLKDVMQLRSLDTATGAQLDTLGDIVGQTRTVTSKYLASASNPTGTVVLDDETYRVVIKSRIRKNVATGTINDVLGSASFMLSTIGGSQAEVRIKEGTARATIAFGRKISEIEKALLKGYISDGVETSLLPRPVGVAFEAFISYETDNYFGFRGMKGAKGFGSRNHPEFDGGIFATRI